MNAPVRFTVEQRRLSTPGRMKPKPDSVDTLRSLADQLRHMPHECIVDRGELVLWLSRMARQIDAIALEGFEPSSTCAAAARVPRQRLTPRPRVDPMAVAEAVFGKRGAALLPKSGEQPAPHLAREINCIADGSASSPATRSRRARPRTVTSAKGRRVKVETRRKPIDDKQIPLFTHALFESP